MANTLPFFDMNALGPNRTVLRPYQSDAVEAARSALSAGRKATAIVIPTGGGKAVVCSNIVRFAAEKGRRTLVMVHLKDLVDQLADQMDRVGVPCGVERAEFHARSLGEPPVVVATVQTMARRLESWPADYFDLIIIDECHHSPSQTYVKVINHFRKAYRLGFTATWDRADGSDVAEIFGDPCIEILLWDLMTAPPPGPYLCRLLFIQRDIQVDLRELRPSGDFSDADLEAAIAPAVEKLANATREEIGERRTIVFTPLIKSAMGMSTAFANLGLRSEWTCGDDPDRASKTERFRAGDLQVMCNSATFLEGFDVPEIAAVVLCRPTKSRSLYAQMIGRATRRPPGKENALVIDFDFLTSKHDLVKPVDLFTGTIPRDVLDVAGGGIKKDKQVDLIDVIEKAGREKEQADRRRVIQVNAREMEVGGRRVAYDPLTAFETVGLRWQGNKDAVKVRATEGQVRYLNSFGVQDSDNLSRDRASKLIDALATRRKAGLATFKQINVMIRNGIPPERARAMTFAEASGELDAIFSQRRA